MRALHQKAKKLAQQYKKCEQELLKIIMEIDQCKMFLKLGYSSLFKYILEELELSEAVTYNFINVARKSQKVPELGAAVLSGKLSISKARKIVSVIEPCNQDQWIKVAQDKTQKQIEREVALASPKKAIVEKEKYVHCSDIILEKIVVKSSIPRVHLSLGVSEKLMIQLRRAQDLESQRQKRNVNLEDTMSAILEAFLEKRDPVRKALRQKAKGKLSSQIYSQIPQTTHVVQIAQGPKDVQGVQGVNGTRGAKGVQGINGAKGSKGVQGVEIAQVEKMENVTGQKGNLYQEQKVKNDHSNLVKVGYSSKKSTSSKFKRKSIPAKLRHAIHLRDGGQCTHRDQKGERCSSRRYLELHHIQPLSMGGEDSFENLVTLCSAHHKYYHYHLANSCK